MLGESYRQWENHSCPKGLKGKVRVAVKMLRGPLHLVFVLGLVTISCHGGLPGGGEIGAEI